ncbi:MAG: hypothetical protein KH353_10155 [Clostridium sp.]|jgi:hypothetical protein|nr:hypothetical protein [Clostridium sp.]
MIQKTNLSFMHLISGILFLVMIFFQMTGMQAAFGLMAAAVIVFELGLMAMEKSGRFIEGRTTRAEQALYLAAAVMIIACMIFQ